MNYAQQMQAVKPAPAGHFLLRSEHWATTHREKPVVPVKLGIRLLSENDIVYIKAIAKSKADKTPDDPRAYPNALVECSAAVAICNAEDASLAHDLFPCPDEQLPVELKPETITAIWDELERLTIATSPVYPEANEVEIVAFVDALADGALEILEVASPVRAVRARKLIRYLLDELNP